MPEPMNRRTAANGTARCLVSTGFAAGEYVHLHGPCGCLASGRQPGWSGGASRTLDPMVEALADKPGVFAAEIARRFPNDPDYAWAAPQRITALFPAVTPGVHDYRDAAA